MTDSFTYLVTDLLSGQILEEIEMSTYEYNRAKNVPGGWDATISQHAPKVSESLFAPWTKAVYCVRDTNVLAGGILIDRNSTTDEGYKIGGAGFMEYYRQQRRTIQGRGGMQYATGMNDLEVSFMEVGQFLIVTDLMAHAENYAGVANVGYDQIRFYSPRPDGLTGIPRTKTYWTYEHKGIGEAIEDMTKLDLGFDYSETYAYVGNRIERYLNLHYPHRGIDSGLVFELGTNAILLGRDEQGSSMSTRFRVLGSGSDDAQVSWESRAYDEEYPSGGYPLIEAYETLNDIPTPELLMAAADRRLASFRTPPTTIEVQVVENIDAQLGSFDWGDVAQIIAHSGTIEIDAPYRIESQSVAIDQGGKSTVKLTLANFESSTGIM